LTCTTEQPEIINSAAAERPADMTALNLPQPDLLKNRMKDIPSELVLCVPSLT